MNATGRKTALNVGGKSRMLCDRPRRDSRAHSRRQGNGLDWSYSQQPATTRPRNSYYVLVRVSLRTTLGIIASLSFMIAIITESHSKPRLWREHLRRMAAIKLDHARHARYSTMPHQNWERLRREFDARHEAALDRLRAALESAIFGLSCSTGQYTSGLGNTGLGLDALAALNKGLELIHDRLEGAASQDEIAILQSFLLQADRLFPTYDAHLACDYYASWSVVEEASVNLRDAGATAQCDWDVVEAARKSAGSTWASARRQYLALPHDTTRHLSVSGVMHQDLVRRTCRSYIRLLIATTMALQNRATTDEKWPNDELLHRPIGFSRESRTMTLHIQWDGIEDDRTEAFRGLAEPRTKIEVSRRK